MVRLRDRTCESPPLKSVPGTLKFPSFKRLYSKVFSLGYQHREHRACISIFNTYINICICYMSNEHRIYLCASEPQEQRALSVCESEHRRVAAPWTLPVVSATSFSCARLLRSCSPRSSARNNNYTKFPVFGLDANKQTQSGLWIRMPPPREIPIHCGKVLFARRVGPGTLESFRYWIFVCIRPDLIAFWSRWLPVLHSVSSTDIFPRKKPCGCYCW